MRRRNPSTAVECLEGRRLLATVSWDGGGGTDERWNNALNWTTDALPGASDDVTITNVRGVDGGPGSNPYLTTPISVRSLTVTNSRVWLESSLTISDTFRVTGNANITSSQGGSVRGDGKLIIEAGSSWGFSPDQSVGDVLVPVDNYGTFSIMGNRDFGPAFHNYGTFYATEGGNFYGALTNEVGGTLRTGYIPNQAGSPSTFGLTRSSTGVISAAPFVNKGFIFTGGSDSSPGSGLSFFSPFGQRLTIYLDASPTLGGSWQSSRAPLAFAALDTAAKPTVTLDPTFSFIDGTLTTRNINLSLRGMSDVSGLRVESGMVSFAQPRTTLKLLQVIGGKVQMGMGGQVLRAADVGIAAAGTLDVGDGIFIDGNQPRYGTAESPPTTTPSPATLPAYADGLRSTFGTDTLTVRQSNAASTRADAGIAYTTGAGLLAHYPAGTFAGEPFDADDFVFRASLRGDTNLDRDVDFADLVTLAQRYNSTTSRGVSDGNVDDPAALNGAVNFNDLVLLAQNYNKSLQVPVAAIAASKVASKSARPSAAKRIGL